LRLTVHPDSPQSLKCGVPPADMKPTWG
jgi:hypothetical protein